MMFVQYQQTLKFIIPAAEVIELRIFLKNIENENWQKVSATSVTETF